MKRSDLNSAHAGCECNHLFDERALPEETPLAMPRHDVDEQGMPFKKGHSSLLSGLSTVGARLFVLVVTTTLSAYGVSEMYGVLSTNSTTFLQWLFLVLFSINFIWMAFAFAQVFLGFLLSLKPKILNPPEAEATFPTAILLPVYNEEPYRVRAALEAMRADLLATAPGKFAIFLLSDTTNEDMWITEEQAFFEIINKDTSGCPVYYRRRSKNTERKAGNIANWVQHFGGGYEAMIVLDADSIMSAESLLTLTHRLAGSPEIGLIQTLPTIVRAKTLYGRLQQFANQCFGPIYAEGLSAWHGSASNFWGHNAIIRTRAFAESCCLPILPGKAPFGGHVLSHDFIEAALMRRAGWGVRFDTDIPSSFEEVPPSLTDVLIRDRRWCQGNLQHKAFLRAKGLALPTRLHLLSGIMSYLSAVFWLALISVGFAIAVQASVVRPEYFAKPSLFPTWPVFDAARALNLFAVSMAIVLAPKIFGWTVAMLKVRRCLQFGGPILLSLSILFEIIASALYAPILMVSQCAVVISVWRGRDGGWKPQSRDDGTLPWSSLFRAHYGNTIFGAVMALIAFLLSIKLFYWLLPITAGLLLSIPLSWLSGSTKVARFLTFFGVLRTPNEKHPEQILIKLADNLVTTQPSSPQPALSRLVNNLPLYTWHIAQMPLSRQSTSIFHAATVTAEWKMHHAENLHHLQEWLTPEETRALLARADDLEFILEISKKTDR